MKISVVGLGRLGLPFAAALANRGFHVIGIDIDSEVVDAVDAREASLRIYEPGFEEYLKQTDNLIATTDMTAVRHTRATVILVPTLSEADGSFSLMHVLDVCTELGAALKGRTAYHVVVIGSTVMPGACGGPIRDALETASNRKVGDDLGLCYCPEFVALGDVIAGFLRPDFVLIGASDIRADFLVTQIYRQLCVDDVPIAHVSLVNAELAKIALNCYVTTKITFANQLAELCEKIPGADVDMVTSTIGLDSRIGLKYLTGATAFGGPCFPRDTRSLVCAAKKVGVRLPLIGQIDDLNRWQTERLMRLVRGQVHRIQAKTIGILGLTYKPDTNVTEESAGLGLLVLMRLWLDKTVIAFDPAAQIGQSVETAQVCADESDIIVITTPWEEFQTVQFHEGQVVIDCWRVLDRAAVEKAGAEYVAIGRGYEEKTRQE